MRYGLIGCGGIGQLRAEALAQMSDQHLVLVHDVDKKRSVELAGQYSTQQSGDWRALVTDEDIEAVIVSTPPSLHAEMCIAALKAGKHVLCEKPLTRTVQEGEAVVNTANETGKFLATGFNYRFYPSVLKAREIFDSGLIGELDHIRSYAGYTALDHGQEWLHDAGVMGGGALRDNGIHLIDLTLYFLGKPAEIKGFTSGRVWEFEGCEDNGFALIRSQEGKIATLQASWTEWNGYRFFLDIYGTRGAIHLSCFPMLTEVTWFDELGGKSQRKTYRFPRVFLMEHLRSYRWVVVQSFVEEFKAFSAAVSGSQGPIASGLDGLRSLEVASAAVLTPNIQ